MSEEGFAEEPWQLIDGANSHVFDGRVMAGNKCVAFVDPDAPEGRLIATAADLYEALAESVSECSEPLCEMCARHEEILAKARGESPPTSGEVER